MGQDGFYVPGAKERVLAALRNEPHREIPVTPLVGHFAARIAGHTIRKLSSDPDVLATSLIAAWERFGYDAIYVAADTWINAEAMGSEVVYPENEPAYGKTLLTSKSGINQLELPDPKSSGRWPLMLKAAETIVKQVGDEVCVIGCMDQSPFSLAAQLRGINQFMLDLLDDPDFAYELLDICTESVIRFGIALAEAGVDVLNTGDSAAGLIGPDLYAKYALPYERKVFMALDDTGLPKVLHICGDVTALLPSMTRSGADGIELDHQVDMADAIQRYGERVCLIGNVDPIAILLNGAPDDVERACTQCMSASKDHNGFILATGCVVAPETPMKNLEVMVQTARKAVV